MEKIPTKQEMIEEMIEQDINDIFQSGLKDTAYLYDVLSGNNNAKPFSQFTDKEIIYEWLNRGLGDDYMDCEETIEEVVEKVIAKWFGEATQLEAPPAEINIDLDANREDFIQGIPNVSYLNDDEADKENIARLLLEVDEDYLFACGDIFTKTWENDKEVEWGCKKSFYRISISKDGSEYYYGVANMLPNDISFFE